MNEPRRLKSQERALPPELVRALRAAPGGPTPAELAAVMQGLSASLGVSLALPTEVSLQAPAPGSALSAGGIGVKSSFSLLAYVAGGTLLGVGISAAAVVASSWLGSPAPPQQEQRAFAKALPSAPLSAGVAVSATELPPIPPRAAASVPAAVGVGPRVAASIEPPTMPQSESELVLVRSAQQAIGRDPERALVLCTKHAELFASGALVQEREVLAIEALLHLGRTEQARARAAQFSRDFPGSAHAPRLVRLLRKD